MRTAYLVTADHIRWTIANGPEPLNIVRSSIVNPDGKSIPNEFKGLKCTIKAFQHDQALAIDDLPKLSPDQADFSFVLEHQISKNEISVVNRENEPTIGRPFEIDKKAAKRFLAWLPDYYLLRKQDPDYAIDYRVEVVVNGEPTARHFGVQVKGRDHLKPNKTPVYPFKTKHLRYYIEQCKEPVFLVLIDASTGRGFWIFIQQYLREKVKPEKLLRKASHSVVFTEENDLSDFSKFEAALQLAERYMSEPVFFQVDGVCRAGTKLVSFEGTWPGSPLKVSFAFPIRVVPPKFEVEFHLLLDAWVRKPLLALPHFDRFDDVLTALSCGTRLTLRLLIDGNRVGNAGAQLNKALIDAGMVKVFEWIRKLRRICQRLNLNLLLPPLQTIAVDDWDTVEYAFDLLEGKTLRDLIPNAKLSFTVDTNIDEALLGHAPGFLRIEGRAEKLTIMGRELSLGPLTYMFSEMSLIKCVPKTWGTKIEMQGTTTSERTIQLTSPGQ